MPEKLTRKGIDLALLTSTNPDTDDELVQNELNSLSFHECQKLSKPRLPYVKNLKSLFGNVNMTRARNALNCSSALREDKIPHILFEIDEKKVCFLAARDSVRARESLESHNILRKRLQA